MSTINKKPPFGGRQQAADHGKPDRTGSAEERNKSNKGKNRE
jgi:hypothetical protein